MPLELIQSLDGLEGHTDRVWTLAWNPQGTILASSGGDKTIRLWAKSKNENWSCVSILTETHSKTIRRLCWSPCGQYLASASFDSTVCIWKQNLSDKSWNTSVNLEGHENEVKSVAWSFDGRYIASCGRDKTVWIWERATADLSKAQQEDLDDDAENWDCSDVKSDHTKDVKHIVWHPQHNILVSTSYDDTVKFLHKEGDDWKCFETLTSHTSTVWSADFSSSGEYLVTCSDDKTVRVWKNHSHHLLPQVEENSWKCVSVIQGYQNRTIYDVSWCKEKNMIASASGDNSIAIYSQDESSPQSDLFICVDKLSEAHECDVNSVKWNPKETTLLASSSDDSSIKLWNYKQDEKGMIRQLTIVEKILKDLEKVTVDVSNQSTNPLVVDKCSKTDYTLTVTDFSNLLNFIQTFQILQSEIYQGSENVTDDRKIEQLLDLKIIDINPPPVDISEIKFHETGGSVMELTINIISTNGEIQYRFRLIIDKSKFELTLPKRSTKLLIVTNELFLLEKTGDLLKVLESGKTQFLLGHLFMFSDVKFALNSDGSKILYIISADRDEKIRLTNYPDTFEIERFCFGHKHFIKRILLAGDKMFVSIDQENNLILWNLNKLISDKIGPLKPELVVSLNGNSTKRLCIRTNV